MEISVIPNDSCDLLEIKGRIDSYTAPDLSKEINAIIEKKHFKIILDLNEVIFISSAGLRVLIDLQKTCKNNNHGEVLLVNVPPRIYETLELAGFVPLFKFFSDVSSAIDAF